MASDEFEVLLVDDGSTDATLQRAEELAAVRPNVRVTAIPNSGWPGRPRNVGIGLARGEYLFFSDHDDAFGPNALAALYRTAKLHDADIVAGKIVRRGRRTPHWPVWHIDQPRAEPQGVILHSMTVHKLYRRELLANDIRFREGRVRLEDYDFTAQAISRAKNISILASEPCYWWIHRSDGTNNSSTPHQPADYWRHYGDSLRRWHDVAPTAEVRDAAILRVVEGMFFRLAPKRYFRLSDDYRAETFRTVAKMVAEVVPASIDADMTVAKRILLHGIRTGDQSFFERLLRLRSAMRVVIDRASCSVEGDRLTISVAAEWRNPLWRLSRTAPARLVGLSIARVPRATRRLSARDAPEVEFTIRHRASGVEWPTQPATLHSQGGQRIVAQTVIDLDFNPFGAQLDTGLWDFWIRTNFLGEGSYRRVLASGAQDPRLSIGDKNNLRLRVIRKGVRPCAGAIHWWRGSLIIHLFGLDAVEVVARTGSKVELARSTVRYGVATVASSAFGQHAEAGIFVVDSNGRESPLGYGGPAIECQGEIACRASATEQNLLSVTSGGR